MSYDIKKQPSILHELFSCTAFFFLKHISQIRIFLKGVKAVYNSQLNLRCPQGLYLCETTSDK